MKDWLDKLFKQEKLAIPRPLYTLEQENQILHDMVQKSLSAERLPY